MNNKIVTLAEGDIHKRASEILHRSLIKNGYTGEFEVLESSQDIKYTPERLQYLKDKFGDNHEKYSFLTINKIFSLSKCNNVETKYIYVDADCIAVENPNYIFDGIQPNLLIAECLTKEEGRNFPLMFETLEKYARKLEITFDEIKWVRAPLFAFSGSVAHIFEEAVSIFNNNPDFIELSYSDTIFLTLACMLSDIKVKSFKDCFGKQVLEDMLIGQLAPKKTFKHYSRWLLNLMFYEDELERGKGN